MRARKCCLYLGHKEHPAREYLEVLERHHCRIEFIEGSYLILIDLPNRKIWDELCAIKELTLLPNYELVPLDCKQARAAVIVRRSESTEDSDAGYRWRWAGLTDAQQEAMKEIADKICDIEISYVPEDYEQPVGHVHKSREIRIRPPSSNNSLVS